MSRSFTVGLIAALLLGAAFVTWVGSASPPAPLHVGATALSLRTQPPIWRFPFEPPACPLAGLLPVKLTRDGLSLAFVSIADGQRVPVVFPHGFAGRLVSGQAVLVAPEGVVVAREGDVLSGLAGASADNGDFMVCFTGPGEYESVVES